MHCTFYTTPQKHQVQKVILTCGVNKRNVINTEVVKSQMTALYRVATEKFPNAYMVIP